MNIFRANWPLSMKGSVYLLTVIDAQVKTRLAVVYRSGSVVVANIRSTSLSCISSASSVNTDSRETGLNNRFVDLITLFQQALRSLENESVKCHYLLVCVPNPSVSGNFLKLSAKTQANCYGTPYSLVQIFVYSTYYLWWINPVQHYLFPHIPYHVKKTKLNRS